MIGKKREREERTSQKFSSTDNSGYGFKEKTETGK